jgi:uncharacterized DUF497 family protein
MSTVIYDFDWDPDKARSNQRKHGVSFRLATSVFRDPMALTIYDEEHSGSEDRWITLGEAENGQLLVVVHTWNWSEPAHVRVRIISARRADPRESRDYQHTPR